MEKMQSSFTFFPKLNANRKKTKLSAPTKELVILKKIELPDRTEIKSNEKQAGCSLQCQ